MIRSWMAHHQGMALLAICNLLFDSPMQRYFHAEPHVMATELLLHERVPSAVIAEQETVAPRADRHRGPAKRDDQEPIVCRPTASIARLAWGVDMTLSQTEPVRMFSVMSRMMPWSIPRVYRLNHFSLGWNASTKPYFVQTLSP